MTAAGNHLRRQRAVSDNAKAWETLRAAVFLGIYSSMKFGVRKTVYNLPKKNKKMVKIILNYTLIHTR